MHRQLNVKQIRLGREKVSFGEREKRQSKREKIDFFFFLRERVCVLVTEKNRERDRERKKIERKRGREENSLSHSSPSAGSIPSSSRSSLRMLKLAVIFLFGCALREEFLPEMIIHRDCKHAFLVTNSNIVLFRCE